MNQKKKYSLLKHIDFLILDLLCVQLSFFIACMARKNTFIDLIDRYLYMAGVLLVAFLFIVMFWNVYSGILRRDFRDEFKSTFAMVAGLFVALTVYCFATKTSEDYSRVVLFTFVIILLPIMYVAHLAWKEYVRRHLGKNAGETLLYIREEDIERKLEQFTNKSKYGAIVTGIITYEKSTRTVVNGIPIVGWTDTLKDYVNTHGVDCVYIYLKGMPQLHEITDFLVSKNVLVYRALRNLEKSSFCYSVVEMNGYKTLCVKNRELSLGFAVTKRLLDLIMALVLIIISLPVAIVTAIAIKVEDGGPVFYKTKRVGQYGKEFEIYKFRSMKRNADQLEIMLTPEELKKYYREYKLENDPRITKVGAFIRRHSIDELPQFINILKGEMALIGPRPLVEEELRVNYPEKKELFLSMKPGLTGYWQVYARNHVGYENGERQKMELYYIEHACWKLDIKIVLKTIQVVIDGDGAQ